MSRILQITIISIKNIKSYFYSRLPLSRTLRRTGDRNRNIPLKETVDLAIDRLFAKKPSLKATRKELRELFEFCTSKTNFIFNGVIYDQIDGIAMGSPLAPVLANLFMGVHESKWLSEYEGDSPHILSKIRGRYFCCFRK